MSLAFYEKPEILDLVAATPHAVLEASAGTGKTYALEHLVIDVLLRTETTLEDILVVTFTEKAAAELRHRLRRKISEVADARETTPPEGRAYWTIDPAARRKLARTLMSFDAASISTIHAFCQRVLLENAFANLRLFDQHLIDGRSAFARAFLDVLREHLAREPEPRSYLAAWLKEHTLDELEGLLYSCHTKRGELRPRFDQAKLMRAVRHLSKLDLKPHNLKPALKRAHLGAPVAEAILTRVGLLRRALSAFLKDDDVPELLETIAYQERRLGSFLGYVVERLQPVVTHEGKLKSLLDGVAALRASAPTLQSAIVQVFAPRVAAYLARGKRQSGHLDFDDMLAMVRDSLDGPEGETLATTIRDRFRYALIDEFQDTDEIQWSIFSRIFLEGGRNSLYVIGDPKQAIYGFRGADVHTYLSAKAHIEEIGGRTVHLIENHRSAKPMLDALNVLLDQTVPGPFFSGEIRYDHPVTCGKPSFSGLEREGAPLSPVHIFSVEPTEERLTATSARHTLGRRFAQEIRSLLQEPRSGLRIGDRFSPIKASDIYVLTRSGREGLEVARHLRAAKVPYAFYKQDGLFQTTEARDVRSLLLAIHDPHRRDRRFRAWQTPFFAVPLESLIDCRDLPGTHPLVETLFVWKSLADAREYNRLFTSIVEDSGVVERELFSKSGERELTNYFHIFEVLLEEATRARATLPELLHTMTAFIDGRRLPEGEEGNVQRLESERDAVQIMTMHKAKGLEAAVVFLYGGLEEVRDSAHVFHEGRKRCLYVGREPPADVETELVEENQRLLYVSMTRAKARLYLPYFGWAADEEAPEAERVLPRLNGAYAEVNRMIDRVEPALAELAPLFTLERLEEAPRRQPAPDEPEREDRLAEWQPPPELLVPPPARTDLEETRREAIGFGVTSYSRIKAAQGGYHGPDAGVQPQPIEEIANDVDGLAPELAVATDLPAGADTGRFIHELLELVPLDVIRRGPQALAEAEPARLFEEAIERYGLDMSYLPHTRRMVYRALAGPFRLGGELLPGVVSADRVVREMEFLYPIPERDGAVHRGFIKGFIDLVFEWRGKIYVVDWKSDLLPGYSRPELTAHVEENYRLQAELYTLAMVKLFDLYEPERFEASFGGTAYIFVRGTDVDGDGTAGVYFARPTHEQVLASERSLLAGDLPAGSIRGNRA